VRGGGGTTAPLRGGVGGEGGRDRGLGVGHWGGPHAARYRVGVGCDLLAGVRGEALSPHGTHEAHPRP
jgi:hypothetical protein